MDADIPGQALWPALRHQDTSSGRCRRIARRIGALLRQGFLRARSQLPLRPGMGGDIGRHPGTAHQAWPAATIAKFVRLFRNALTRTGVRVTSGMTGPYGRLNHFGHPDADVRRYYVDWFKTFADISAELGASGMGTQFAIFTHRDFDDPE